MEVDVAHFVDAGEKDSERRYDYFYEGDAYTFRDSRPGRGPALREGRRLGGRDGQRLDALHGRGEFGFGAEIGISTQKLHARGSMGRAEMTSTTYVATGDGHIR